MQAQEGLLRHKSIGIDTYMDKRVGFGSEGASVNCGKKEGIKALLQESKEWLVFGSQIRIISKRQFKSYLFH